MKSLLIAFALLLAPLAARAACPSYPYTLTNGQVADANQVMANFNSIATCVNSLSTSVANAPVNTNITSIGGLTTPLSVSQGGTGASSLSGFLTTLGGLAITNNLDDLASVPTARTNLGLGSAALLNVGTTAGTVAAGNDSRFAGPTQNSQSASYAIAATDAGGEVYHPSADTTPRTWTIQANASVPLAVGTKIELVNDCSAGAITLAITSDTLEWFPTGGTGSRTLAACSISQLTKVTPTEWVLTGVGVT
jgi:hypothetical protein